MERGFLPSPSPPRRDPPSAGSATVRRAKGDQWVQLDGVGRDAALAVGLIPEAHAGNRSLALELAERSEGFAARTVERAVRPLHAVAGAARGAAGAPGRGELNDHRVSRLT